MFRSELDELESRYSDRLKIRHVLSRDPLHIPELCGRIDRDKLERWLNDELAPETVDEWFLCGPIDLTATVRETLTEHRVDPERIHLELFLATTRTARRATGNTRIDDQLHPLRPSAHNRAGAR